MYIDYLYNHPKYVETVSNWICNEFVIESEKNSKKLEQITEYFSKPHYMLVPNIEVKVLQRS